jgi:hypothetical protein
MITSKITAKVNAAVPDDPFAAFDEWASVADAEAYAGLVRLRDAERLLRDQEKNFQAAELVSRDDLHSR